MKKMMVAIAGALLTAMASAATADWSVYEICDSATKEYAQNYLVYFADAAVLTQADAITAITNADFSVLANAFMADDLVIDGEAYATAGDYANGATVEGYAIILNAETADAATYFFVTDMASADVGGTGQPASMEFYADATADASNWTKIGGEAVPEPTSALMLLVGLAGLALKRKVA